MRTTIKKVIEATASTPIAKRAYRVCGVVGHRLKQIDGYAQYVRDIQEAVQVAHNLFPAMQVQSGPFRGLRYPKAVSVGSTLLPKLLGSYECELHPFLEEMLTTAYDAIVDIGCAEGYYAVGTALRCPGVAVHAFDIDPSAREACRKMAELNGVTERMRIGGACDEANLLSLPLGTRALIISDCEGYESELFHESLVRALAQHDFIIEIHDFLNIELSSLLKVMFSKTHSCTSVMSVDDIQKVHNYRYSVLDGYSKQQKLTVLKEGRPAIMEWLVAVARTHDGLA